MQSPLHRHYQRGGKLDGIGQSVLASLLPTATDAALDIGKAGINAVTDRVTGLFGQKRKRKRQKTEAPITISPVVLPAAKAQIVPVFDDNPDDDYDNYVF